MYLMTCTRPDLAYPLSLLARYVAPNRHQKVHWDAAKRVLRYLCSTSGMGFVLGGQSPVVFTGHADASWVDDSATQRSSQGYTFSLGSGSVSWRSTRSSSVLSSSCEAEIYSGAMAAQELRWLTYVLTDLGELPRSPPVLYQRGQLRLAYVATRANTADVFTKALPPGDHQALVGGGGVVVDLDKGVLRLHQRKYCEGLAEKYGLQDGGKPATPLPLGFTVEPFADEEVVGESDRKLFHSMVGALNYAANHTRPDIVFATSRLASVVSRPSHEQLEAAKRLVRYVSATASVGLEYSAVRQRLQRGAADLSKGEMLLTCYTDASFNSVKADGTSIGGYVCLFGGGAVSWRSKKQNEVGLSSCETEYMALHHGVKEVVWLRRLLEEIGVCQKEPTVILCDNELAVKLAKNACLHGLTQHIRPKWHWTPSLVSNSPVAAPSGPVAASSGPVATPSGPVAAPLPARPRSRPYAALSPPLAAPSPPPNGPVASSLPTRPRNRLYAAPSPPLAAPSPPLTAPSPPPSLRGLPHLRGPFAAPSGPVVASCPYRPRRYPYPAPSTPLASSRAAESPSSRAAPGAAATAAAAPGAAATKPAAPGAAATAAASPRAATTAAAALGAATTAAAALGAATTAAAALRSNRHCISRPWSNRHCSSRPWSSRHCSSRPRSSHHYSSSPPEQPPLQRSPLEQPPLEQPPLQQAPSEQPPPEQPPLEQLPLQLPRSSRCTVVAASSLLPSYACSSRLCSSVARVCPSPPNSFVSGTLVGVVGVAVVGVRDGSRGTAHCPYVIRTGARTGQPCGTLGHAESRCFARLSDAWRTEFGDAAELPDWVELLRLWVDIYSLDYDAILTAMYALPTSDEGDCYLCVPPDPGLEAAALGAGEAAALGASASAAPSAGESALSGTASAQVFHTFTLDLGASRSFFRDRTTLTPLSRPVAVSLADPSRGPVLASFSTVLPCPAAPSGTLSGLYLPSFSTNLVSGADLQDQGVDQFTPASQRVTHCTCARTGRHLATFTRRPGSSLYTLSTESPPVPASGHVAASSQVFAAASGSGPESAPCSCRLLSHQTLLWHHRLGHPSLPRLRGMASRVLVSGLPRSLPPLPPGPAPTCVPCVEGRQRAAPHSSETAAPLQTLHMDVWGPARVRGQGHERYFLLVVDDYSRYTTVFPLRSKGDVTEVLIDWIRAARLQLRESFSSDFPVLRLHSYRGGEFSSARLGAFYRPQSIRLTFTLPASPQQNGIAERRIGMVMDVARTSMIHAAAPHFLWPFAVQYAAHQLNLQPRVSLPETSPTLRWTGKVGDASAFRFYHPTSRRVLSSQDVTFDESVPYYHLFPYRTAPLPPPPLFLAPGPSPVDPLPPQGPAPSRVSQVDAVEPVEVAVDSGAARGAEPVGAGCGGAEPGAAEFEGAVPGGAESGGAAPGGAEPGGTELGGAEPGGAESARVASRSPSSRRELLSPQELREWFARRWSRAAGAGGPPVAPGPGGARTGGTGAVGTGGAAAAARVGPAGASGATVAGATGGVGARVGAAGASGAAGAGATGGVGAGVGPAGGTAGAAGGTGAAGAAGVGAVGAGGAAGTGAATCGTGPVPVGTEDPARPSPYFVPLLEQ
ncbi:unnamed protein product, partial [Closterium sp. NIES-53]